MEGLQEVKTTDLPDEEIHIKPDDTPQPKWVEDSGEWQVHSEPDEIVSGGEWQEVQGEPDEIVGGGEWQEVQDEPNEIVSGGEWQEVQGEPDEEVRDEPEKVVDVEPDEDVSEDIIDLSKPPTEEKVLTNDSDSVFYKIDDLGDKHTNDSFSQAVKLHDEIKRLESEVARLQKVIDKTGAVLNSNPKLLADFRAAKDVLEHKSEQKNPEVNNVKPPKHGR